MNELEEKFYETGVVPVVVLEDAEDAVPLAQALVEGGLLRGCKKTPLTEKSPRP